MVRTSADGAGLCFPENCTLAPHVLVGYVDISSGGVRALLLLREALARWAGPEKTQSRAGTVWGGPAEDSEDGAAVHCVRAWESASSEQHATPAAALQIDTFHGADGQAAVSVVCINAQLPVGSANCIALDLVRKILADKVSSVSVVASVRFNPKGKDLSNMAKLLQFRKGVCMRDSSEPLVCWDPACEINDSLLAAIIQILSLEHGVEMDCVLAAGYRLPKDICLNLPLKQSDPTVESVRALYDAFTWCNASIPLKAVGGGQELPDFGGVDLDKLRPSCVLTLGEFAPSQPDTAAAFYK